MRGILRELGIASTPEVELIIDRAWQVHSIREEVETKPTVSRSSLTYAAATISPLVLAILETNGLNMRTWESSLSFDERPKFDDKASAPDYPVNPQTTMRAFRTYAERSAERPLDALGLVWAMLLKLDGQALRHLESAGLDMKHATRRFSELIGASRGTFIDAIGLGYGLTDLSQIVLRKAQHFAASHGVALRALTASEVLIAAARTEQAQEPTAPHFFGTLIDRVVKRERFDELVRQWMDWYDKGVESNEESYNLWTQPLTAIIERAQQLAEQATGTSEAAISARHLVGALIASRRWAANSGIPDFFRAAEIDPRKLAAAYYQYLSAAPVDGQRDNMAVWRAFLGLGTESFVPRFNAEDLAGGDLLNVMGNVNAFASLLASNKIDPPLSIGLFGDWGSGKSFFMAKMREEIEDRARRASGRPESVFHERIVQIEFNAWHYVEANLWASMVDHLFRNLKLTYEKPTDQCVAERREELLKKLDQLMEQRVRAEERVQQAEVERDRAAQELEAKKKAADARASYARGMRAKDVWELVTINQTEKDELQTHLHTLGVERILKSKEDVRKTVDELRSVQTRTSLLANWVLRQPRSLLLLLVLLVLAPFGAIGLVKLIALIDKGAYTEMAETISQVAAFAGSVTGWLTLRLAKGKKLLQLVENARDKIDANVEKAEANLQKDINNADVLLNEAVGAVTAAQQDVVANEKEVHEAKQKLLELTNGYRLNRFIDERAASDDYRKLLGVLATVRSDFSTLSELMYPKEGKSDVGDKLRIDRIILYIDDLDRCEPDRVIEVLQAVHLLLAFKLFVVVVGVDARWVSESLRQKHLALRGRSANQLQQHDDGVPGFSVEPHDYLEKIFQVPFWLDPLRAAAAGSYIGNLLAADMEQSEKTPQPDQRSSRRTGVGTAGQTDTHQAATVGHHTIDDSVADEEADPKQLTIAEKERTYMQDEKLAALVRRSPRTAKRFVNTYRFYRASIPLESLDKYLQDRKGAEYRCSLLMLAIVVGAPDVSLELFAQMRAAKTLTLTAFAKKIERDENHTEQWENVAAALEDFGKAEGVTVGDLAVWIDRVSRYSFRPPYAQQPRKAAAQPEYLIRIRNDSPDHNEMKKAARKPPLHKT